MVSGEFCLKDVTMIDGEHDEPVERSSVLVQEGRIIAVGSLDEVRPPGDATIVDASGLTVMPGMVDCHFHGAYTDVTCWEDYDLRRPIEHTVILAARNAQTLLESGFTTAREVGSRALVSVAVRDLINEGILLGPRLLASGRIISTTGGLADGYGYWVTNEASLGQIADGPRAVLQAVREQVKYGVDVVKIEASGTGISPFSDSRRQTMTTEEMAAAVHEAHRNGVRVACHAQATEGIKNAVRAGVDTVEHGTFLDEEGAMLMKQRGTGFVPTISVMYLYVHKGPEVGVPPWVVEKFRGDLEAHMKSVRLALEAGIPMGVGSDSGHRFNPQSDIALELELMVKAGFTPMHAIRAATSIGADLVGLAETTGKIKPGLFADLLVVSGDPLADVGILRDRNRIERVYKEGRLVAGKAVPRHSELEFVTGLTRDQ